MKYFLVGSTVLLFGLWIALEWWAHKKLRSARALQTIIRSLLDGIEPPDLPPRWDREKLTVVCMDCQAHIGGPKVNLQDAMQARAVSHGLCPDCLRRRLAELDR